MASVILRALSIILFTSPAVNCRLKPRDDIPKVATLNRCHYSCGIASERISEIELLVAVKRI